MKIEVQTIHLLFLRNQDDELIPKWTGFFFSLNFVIMQGFCSFVFILFCEGLFCSVLVMGAGSKASQIISKFSTTPFSDL